MKRSLCVLVTALAFWAGSSSVSAETQRVLKVSIPTSGDAAEQWMTAFKAGVESRSGGRLRLDLYPANRLGQIPATIDGVVMGTIEFTMATVGFFVGLEPRFGVLDAGGVFDDLNHAQRALQDPVLQRRIASFGASKGVEVVMIYAASPMLMVSRSPVVGLADLVGKKVRAPGSAPLQMEPLRRLGASPITISLGETLPALQNRTIDAMMSSASAAVGYKFYDVAKHMTEIPGAFVIAAVLANREVLRSLGPELEALVREEAGKAATRTSSGVTSDVERMRVVWQSHGGKIYTLSAEDQRRFGSEAETVVRELSETNKTLREDYEALKAAAQRSR